MQTHAQAALSRVREQYQKLPLGTLSIAFLCVTLQCVLLLLSCLSWVAPSSHWLTSSSSLLETVALVPSQVLPPHYQVWRVLTAAFFHAGILHVAFNTLCLLSVGAVLERRAGTALFVQLSLILVVSSGCIYVGAAYASSLLFSSSWLAVGCVGYSGVLFGYLGIVAFLPEAPAEQALCGVVNVPARMYPFVLLLVIQLAIPNVSLLGHLSGLVAGCLYSAGVLPWLHCGPALLRSTRLQYWAVATGGGNPAEGANLLPQHGVQEVHSRFIGCPAQNCSDARGALRGDFLWIHTAFSNFHLQARWNKWASQMRGLFHRSQVDESDETTRAGSQPHNSDQKESKITTGTEKAADTRLWVGKGYKLGGGGSAPQPSSRHETIHASSASTREKPRPQPEKAQAANGNPQLSADEHGSNIAGVCDAGAEELSDEEPRVEEVDSIMAQTE